MKFIVDECCHRLVALALRGAVVLLAPTVLPIAMRTQRLVQLVTDRGDRLGHTLTILGDERIRVRALQ